jgi:hypothetical protein
MFPTCALTLALAAVHDGKPNSPTLLPPRIVFPPVRSIIDFDHEIRENERLLARLREVNAGAEEVAAVEEVLQSLKGLKRKYK